MLPPEAPVNLQQELRWSLYSYFANVFESCDSCWAIVGSSPEQQNWNYAIDRLATAASQHESSESHGYKIAECDSHCAGASGCS